MASLSLSSLNLCGSYSVVEIFYKKFLREFVEKEDESLICPKFGSPYAMFNLAHFFEYM